MSNSSIPIPGVILIDEQIHDNLYPPNVEQPARMIKTLGDEFKSPDYDIDSNDQRWLESMAKIGMKLKPESFERAIEFLEVNCNDGKVKALEDLRAQKIVKYREDEAIYDYWLDRRLKDNEKLMLCVKQREKSRRRKVDDPYVAFRQCDEKMSTRKNRDIDHHNYIQMLKERAELKATLDSCERCVNYEAVQDLLVKQKLAHFKVEYKSKMFRDEFLLQRLDWNQLNEQNVLDYHEQNSIIEEAEDSDVALQMESLFDRQEGCEYHKVSNFVLHRLWTLLNMTIDNFFVQPIEAKTKKLSGDPKNFFPTTEGIIRRRIGRGGRTVYDRLTIHKRERPQYRSTSFACRVICTRIRQELIIDEGSSKFRLEDLSVSDYNVNYQDIVLSEE